MADVNEWNQQVIKEFRANEGRVGGPFEGQEVALLHSRGRRSGIERVNPLAYQKLDGGWAVFASFAGATRHPDWYLNLMAEPRTTVEIGTESFDVVARDTAGAERLAIWERQKAAFPTFAEYEVKAGDRVIPVVVLEPAG